MDQILEQLTLHPWVAVLAGLAFLLYLVFNGRRSAARARVVPGGIGLALVALAVGIVASVQIVVDTFHALALVGSAGEGSVAAGLGESMGALLFGLIFAILTLVAALIFSRRVPAGPPGEAETGSDTRSMRRAVLISATLLSIVLVALGLYDLWFVAAIPGWVRGTTGNVQSVSQMIANHINRLVFLALAAAAGSVALSGLAHFFSGGRTPSPRQTLWGRTLLILLLVFCLAETVMAWRQLASFHEAALIGRFS